MCAGVCLGYITNLLLMNIGGISDRAPILFIGVLGIASVVFAVAAFAAPHTMADLITGK